MPFYPTDSNRARRVAPKPPANWPGRDFRRLGQLPVPANDNPRYPIPLPANDNDKPPLPGKPARSPARFAFRRLSPMRYMDYFEWGYNSLLGPDFGHPPLPSGWWRVHGPNSYAPPFHNPPSVWQYCWYAPHTGAGPDTGRIAYQAIVPEFSSPAAFLAYDPFATQMGFWIKSPDVSIHHAQHMAFIRSPTQPLPGAVPADQPAVIRSPFPQVDPFAEPFPWFSPVDPSPLPRPNPLPRRNPAPGRRTWPEPYPSRVPEPFRAPDTAPIPEPMPVPMRGPVQRVQAFTGLGQRGQQLSRNPNGRHPVRRPPPRTHETKGILAQTGWRLLNAFGVGSEVMDIVDAAWDALPAHRKNWSFYNGKPIRPAAWKRASDVFNGARDMDIDHFVKNLIANNLEDMFLGMQAQGFNPQRRLGGSLGRNHRSEEEKEYDPTNQSPIDWDQLVDDVWRTLEGS